MQQRVMLYFGSFNPVHRGHIALAEYVLDAGLCDLVTLIVSPQSPYKEAAELAPELARFEMAELACAASRHPDSPASWSPPIRIEKRIRSPHVCSRWRSVWIV